MKQSKILMLILLALSVIIFSGCQFSGDQAPSYKGKTIAPLQADYPHWNFNNWETYKKLVKLNTFIEENKDKGYLAVFDWDGTLYNENIPVKEMNDEKFAGQPAWYIWSAYNAGKFSFSVFPMFKTKDGDFVNNVVNEDKYLEGRTNIHPDGYSKFTRTSIFTAGMTPENMAEAVMEFLKVYQPEKYAFMPMLDVLQKMVNSGFKVWIITGSNQYFVAVMLGYIEQNMYYGKDKKYDFNICKVPFESETGHIAGNGLKMMDNNEFSVVYDNRYVTNPDGKLYIVDEYGKEVVVKNLEKKEKTEAKFVAGNSGGDFYDTRYVVDKPGTLAIAVEARGDLTELVSDYPEKIIPLNSDEI